MYGKSGYDYSNTANERVTYNLSKAESLLDDDFKIGADHYGRPNTSHQPAMGRLGMGGKSNYTGSEQDSDTNSNAKRFT
jgi:hypothetical protein